ncbi:DUF5785 family protein [Natrinema limicola]|uniref:Uncharacterized protein n=1 Tax=Natrinema limicola JCM 13563 TaxID=1230457 RepID=M0C6D4_9EURY|nr:hypothetical protein C476_16055 [Natrinema limicola JCM 13563]
MTIGRAAAAVTGGDGRESATDFVLTAVRQYEVLFSSVEGGVDASNDANSVETMVDMHKLVGNAMRAGDFWEYHPTGVRLGKKHA